MTDGYHESLLYAYHFNINVRHHFIDNCQIYIVIYISITIFNISAPITMIAYRLTYRYHVVCANRYHSFFKNNVSHLSSHNTSLCFPVNHGIVGSASLKNVTFGYQVSAHCPLPHAIMKSKTIYNHAVASWRYHSLISLVQSRSKVKNNIIMR